MTSLWLSNYVNMLYHTNETSHVIYLRIFTFTHAAPFKKNLVFVKLTYFLILKNNPIMTKIIPFSECMFIITVMFDRPFFLSFFWLYQLTFNVVLKSEVGFICILLFYILFRFIPSLPLKFANCFKNQKAKHITPERRRFWFLFFF